MTRAALAILIVDILCLRLETLGVLAWHTEAQREEQVRKIKLWLRETLEREGV